MLESQQRLSRGALSFARTVAAAPGRAGPGVGVRTSCDDWSVREQAGLT